MRLLLAFVFTLLVSPLHAAVAVVANTPTPVSFTTNATPTITYPGAVTSASLLYCVIRNGTDVTTVITGVADSVNGAWTLLEGPDDSGTATRSWVYFKQNTAAGTPTVTVTFDVAISGHIACAEFSGAATSGGADVSDPDPASTTSGTDKDSDAIVLTGAGGVICGMVTAGTVTLTMDNGETNVTNASTRAHIMFRAEAAGGSETCNATASASVRAIFNAASFLEAGGAAPTKQLMSTGVGPL